MTPIFRIVVLSAVLASGCAKHQTAGSPLTPAPGELPGNIQWVQRSAEYAALSLQAYRVATAHVEAAVKGRTPGSWAVILDADDTVINNTEYQARLARKGVRHTEDLFTAWAKERASTAVPGAQAFLARVRALGGRIAIVTNRIMVQCPDTEAVFKTLGMVYDVMLCRPDGAASDKNPRFDAVAAGQTAASARPVEVIAFVGDNILDFPGGSQALRGQAESAFSAFGARFFILPNPMYGSWEARTPAAPPATSAAPRVVQPGAPGEASRVVTGKTAPIPKFTAADVSFMQGMIGHHAQALEMVTLLKTRTARQDMQMMGLRIEVSQRDEIQMMQDWLRARSQTVPDEHAHHMHDAKLMPGMLSPEQMKKLEGAKGSDFDKLFLEYMIQHHQGALTMVKELMESPGAAQESAIFAFAADVEADQAAEILRMRALRGSMGK